MVQIGININNDNQVIAFFMDNVNGQIRVDVSQMVFDNIFNKSIPYKYTNNKLSIDTGKQEFELKEKEIQELKEKLQDTDHVVIKLAEAQVTGKTVNENYSKVLGDRQAWRDKINLLEK